MSLTEAELQETEAQLNELSPTLLDAFRAAREELPPLTDGQERLWIEEGIGLATHSLRSWEASVEYFRVGPVVLQKLDEVHFRQWVGAGRELAQRASTIAAAYFRATPAVLPALSGVEVRDWAYIGERLHRATWKSISLAGDFFSQSPAILEHISLDDLGRLSRVLDGISERSPDLASACLQSAPNTMRNLDKADLLPFLEFAQSMAATPWPEANMYFQRGPEMVRAIDSPQRQPYLDLCMRVARRIGRETYGMFAEGAVALRDVGPSLHAAFLEMATQVLPLSPVAAMSFVKSAPRLAERLRPGELAAWHASGLDILRTSIEGGEAYFSLESGKAEQMMNELSVRVELGSVSELLRLYGKALTGSNVSVQPISELAGKGIGWVSERGPSTEGSAVYLPDHVEQYDNKPENFAVYKVYATHQTGHMEFGSFDFSFRRAGKVLPRRRHQVERDRRAAGAVKKRKWLTDMERYFDLFASRQMAADIFTIVEDLRIDSRIRSEYSGTNRAGRRVRDTELTHRPEIRELPLRQAFIEILVRVSLDGETPVDWIKSLDALLFEAVTTLNKVRNAEATIEDTAEATLILYNLAARLPNLKPADLDDEDWAPFDEDMMNNEEGDGDGEGAIEELADGEEQPYESPDQVDFRGDFKPELVQLLMRMRYQQLQGDDEDDLSPLSAEEIQEMLEKSVEIDLDFDDMDLSELSSFLDNLEKASRPLEDEDSQDGMPDPEEPGGVDLPGQVLTFYYDEWDFRAADYKPRWCTLHERVLDQGTDEFYERSLREHSGLVTETQRQFEMLRPETFRKIKRLEDGEDIDLDAAIDFLVQKRAGHGDIQKIFWRRNKVERDVAVAFLLDMSASTDEEIEKRRPRRDGTDVPPTASRYAQWTTAARPAQSMDPPKRIIDVEKESLVLLTHALEVIHDRYGIYGFSGYGRENVEYFVIKDLEEPFDDTIRRRIDRVTPIRSTRMGPAIRHTAHKLDMNDAKVKILFLVSDGRPQDHGYGRDRTEKEYAMHDTHKALIEAKQRGIVPFALTVDKEGHDYLGEMCGDIAYEVLGDISLLPSRLPTLYRRLTE